MKRAWFFVALLGSWPVAASAADLAALVADLKPSVVNVERSATVALNTDQAGRAKASGFIVDARRGIIATNRHVAGTGPSLVKIVFENGQSTNARLLHYDAWHDFAFLRIDPPSVDFQLREVRLGDSFALQEQEDVLLIGNNDGQEYSVKFGKVSNLVLDKGVRHSATIQTTFDRTGGSSGSPVFNVNGEAVAIHFAGSDTTSFELRIEYVKDALDEIRRNGHVRRGDIGLDLKLLLVSDAEKHFHLPAPLVKKVLGVRPGLKHMIAVESRVPGTPASDAFLPGDLLLTVDGVWIGDDLYRLDRIVNAKVGSDVAFSAIRNGREFSVRLPVRDAEALKARRFARFAGGVFQDLTPEVGLANDVQVEGVLLTQAEKGSSMSGLGSESTSSSGRYLVLVEKVNGSPTPNLDAFLHAVRPLRNREHVHFLIRDRNAHDTGVQALPVTLDLKFSPLEVWVWSARDLDWVRSGVE